MTTAIKTTLPTAFVASAQHDPRYNRKEAFDEAVTGFSESLIYFASKDLFPGQASSFGSVANALASKGANSFAAGGGTAPTFTGGGMALPTGAAGTPGLKIGATATATVPHVSDLTLLAAGERPFFCETFKATAAGDGSARPIHALGDSGAGAGGKLQYALALTSNGLRLIVAGISVETGFVPTVGKIYVVGSEIVPNAAGTSAINFWVYNVADDELIIEAASISLAYAAWAPMVNGGAMIGLAYALNSMATLDRAVVYRVFQGVVSTTSVAPRTASEQFFTECRLMREAFVATKIV